VQYTLSTATGTWPEIFLGLTGADWPNKDLSIVAYKITLKNADGAVLAEHASYLWALPKVAAPVVAATSPADSPAKAGP
jgi:hypothetical protein